MFDNCETSKMSAYEQAEINEDCGVPAEACPVIPHEGQRSPSKSGGIRANAEQLTPKSVSALNQCTTKWVEHISKQVHFQFYHIFQTTQLQLVNAQQ